MNTLQDFTNLYSLSKTLRFELVPVGKTLEHIQTKGLLSQDEQRADSYKKVKKIIDEYHKAFIEKALTGITLTKLNDFDFQYRLPKEQQNEDTFKKIKESLRKEIVAAFGKRETKKQFDNLFKKELIKEDLLNWVDETNRELVKEFELFTTYFTGFHTNRKNMYSADEKSTAIAYRIVHENLPKFIDNIRIYDSIKSNHKDLDFSTILSEMEEVIQGKTLDEIFTLDFFNNVLSQNGIDFINYIIGGRSEKAGEKKIKGLNEYINLYNQQQKDKKKRAPKLKPLYKQILSDRNSISWLPETFNTDVEVLDAINGFYREGLENVIIDGKGVNILNKIERLLKSLSTYDDLSKIYLRNDTTITSISQTLFADYDVLGSALNYYYEKFVNQKWINVPITMNFKAPENDYINQQVNEFLRNNPDVKIIGLDRGERHLIYLTLIDQQGNIIQQESLNTMKDEEHKIETPYHQLLDKKEEERDKARKSWNTIENIKELKEGYISQAVHKIAKMMIEHNAIVVLEDLNFGFKQGRFKVEKQIYQKLEKMLIDKLNYLVIKDNKANEAGGIYKALQLTNKFKSFKDMGKQTGFLFYVPAWNTSKIDPTTGFVDFLKPKYESIEQAKMFLKKFKNIRFNPTEKYFEFSFDYKDFTTKADDTRTEWTICTYGERIEKFLNSINKWDDRPITLNDEFTAFFDKYQIDYKGGKDLKEQILQQTEKAFFEKLFHLLRLTLQMRNSKTGTEIDYLISPVINRNSEFYDSRKSAKNLSQDADANGAFNIARKGLVLLKRLKKGIEEFEKSKKTEKNKPSQWLTNKEWLQFAQDLRK